MMTTDRDPFDELDQEIDEDFSGADAPVIITPDELLDEVTRRALVALDFHEGPKAPLLAVLVDVAAVRLSHPRRRLRGRS